MNTNTTNTNIDSRLSQEFISTRRIFMDYSLMLLAVMVSAYFIHGMRVIYLSAISGGSSFIFRLLGEKIVHTKRSAKDFASFVAGVSVAMLLPITAPWWMALVGGFFASVICIVPFGSVLKTPFVPATASICFLILCWSDEMFLYSETEALSLSKMLIQGNSIVKNPIAIMGALTGSYPSAIGTGSVLILIGALIYLTFRRPKDTISAYTFLLTVMVFALLFPRVSAGRFMSLVMELCSGMLLFSAVFFMTYPSILPERNISRALWGVASGIICMLIRYFGFFEESVCFGILISHAIFGFFDSIPLTKGEKAKIVSSPLYTGENEQQETPQAKIVPKEILEEIPDVKEDNKEDLTEEQNDENVDVPPAEDSLEQVIEGENTIVSDDLPFQKGGNDNE